MALYNRQGNEIDSPSSLNNRYGDIINPLALYDRYGSALGTSVYQASGLISAINNVENTVNGYTGTKFAYLTDLHLSGNGQLMLGKNTVNPYWSIAVLNEVCKRGLVEAVVIGGDLINAYSQISSDVIYESTLEDATGRIQALLAAIDTNGLPMYVVKGNHDLNTKYDDVMSNTDYPNKVNDTVWQSLTEPYATNAVYNSEDKSGYLYADLSNNVRLCVWNQYTGDCIDSTGSDGDGTSNTESYWMRDTAYEDGKICVTIYHNPESYATNEGMYTRYFVDGGTYGGKTWTGGQKAFVINSHNHADNLSYLFEGVMTQNVPQFNVDRAFAVTESTASNVTIDSGNDRACVSIFTIDTVNDIVYETRIGRGESRQASYGA